MAGNTVGPKDAAQDLSNSELQPELRAKPLPRKDLVEPDAALELVPARMVNEVLYCERLYYLEAVQGEFADNVFTVDGRAIHRRADKPGGKLPTPPTAVSAEPGADLEGDDPREPRPYVARSVWLSSEKLGLTAKIDVVEGDETGTVVPIEYKRGTAPNLPEGAYLPERAQLCAQVLLLREHGYRCDHAQLYFAKNKRRVSITIDEELVNITLAAAARARALSTERQIPRPLQDSPKCQGCSLVGICLPDEVNLLRRLDAEPANDAHLRRLHPPREDRLPVYVQEQGARVGLDGEVLSIKTPAGDVTEARIPDTAHVSLVGNVQITTQALRALFDYGVPVSFFTTGGYFVGRATGHDTNNVELRIAQYRAADSPPTCLSLAQTWIASKIRNCRTLLRRNHDDADPVVLGELEQLAKKAEAAPSLDSLLGIEGSAARTYFAAFAGMLNADMGFDLGGRNRRPPKDPTNALLSLAYSLLTKDMTLAVAAVGLDPLRGFYHQPRYGRVSLALDLMEEFRPLIADSTVINAINQGIVTPADFRVHPTGVSLEPPARRRFILAYQRRLEQIIAHPVFGYRITYRAVLEVQARLLGRVLTGEIPTYPAFRTR
ncbi:MAG: CRISPR-associated endonuclease Cas1 [Polyangiaceae bacterium]